MTVCYFNNDFDKHYDCEYKIENFIITIIIKYDVANEIKSKNGMRCFGPNTKFDNRDITIVDHENNKTMLVKDAYYAGINSIFGTIDDNVKTTFRGRLYFVHRSLEKISNLSITPKIKKIKIYSKSLNQLIGCSSLSRIIKENENIIQLSKENEERFIEVNSNNIKRIIIGDTWNERYKYYENINIEFFSYIEIELMRRVNYDLIGQYIHEIQVYLQLLIPNKYEIHKIQTYIDNCYYELNIPLMKTYYTKHFCETTVNDELLEFLKKCYKFIPYRNSKTEIRNIPYIVMNLSERIEDNFLMFYRFIECYYKKQKITKTFISHSMKVHYLNNHNQITEKDIENYSQEIVTLRNHYVHSGYYIKNSCLRISFGKGNPKNHTDNNVDTQWIYDRTKILYDVAIDIIFKDMLKYDEYKYNKHF